MTNKEKKTLQSQIVLPGYSSSIISFLEKKAELKQSKDIAVIYSGYGELCRNFLENGNIVFCVEPDGAKREQAEKKLKMFYNLISIDGTCENTTLSDESVDMIVSNGHFVSSEFQEIKTEFRRILKKDGYLVFIRNVLKRKGSDIISEYDKLLRKNNLKFADFTGLIDLKISEKKFFRSKKFFRAKFDNPFCYDYKSLKETLLKMTDSELQKKVSNYISEELKKLFNKHKKGNKVILTHETIISCGRIY